MNGSAGLAVGAAPGLAFALAADVGVRWPKQPLSLSLEVRALLPAGGNVGLGYHVTTSRYTVGGVGCGHFLRLLATCGLAETGVLLGNAHRELSEPSTLFYGAIGGRALFEYPLVGHLAVRASADTLIALVSPTVGVDTQPAWRTSLVSGMFMGGLGGTF